MNIVAIAAASQWVIFAMISAFSRSTPPKRGMRGAEKRLLISTALFAAAWLVAFDVRSLIRNLVRAGLQAPLPTGIKGFHPFLVDGLERELIEEVMRQCDGTQVKAARVLGINRNTLHKKIEQYKADDTRAEEATGR